MKTLLLPFLALLCFTITQAQSVGDIVITEFLYNSASVDGVEAQYVEIFNTTNAPINLGGLQIGDSQDADWNNLPAVDLPANGLAVICGSSAADFTAAFGALPNGVVLISILDEGQMMFGMSNNPNSSNETVAIRITSSTIIDVVNYADDGNNWPSDSPDGVSIFLNIPTTQIITSGAMDNDDGSNWNRSVNTLAGAFSSTVAGIWDAVEIGSPGVLGTRPVTPTGDIVITEFLYNSASTNSVEAQFMEIFNPTNATINLGGLEVGDSQDGDWNFLPPVELPAQGIAVICGSSAADFTAAFGALPTGVVLISLFDQGEAMFAMSDDPSGSNETIAIRNESGTMIDVINYDDSGISWPFDVPSGASIFVNLPVDQIIANGATANDAGTSWGRSAAGYAGGFSSTPFSVWDGVEVGSPGTIGVDATFPPGSIVITEILYNTASNERSEAQFVEIFNTTNAPINLGELELGDSQDDDWNELPVVDLPARGIAVIYGSSRDEFVGAFGISPGLGSTLLISLEDIGQSMFSLANSPTPTNEVVVIRIKSGPRIDAVNYDDDGTIWPSDNPEGVSIYLDRTSAEIITSGTTDNDLGTNWSRSVDGVAGAFNSFFSNSSLWDASEVSSPGIIGSDAAFALPVELLNFSAERVAEATLLKWQTASEVNNHYLAVERSTDARTWSEIGRVPGAGTTDEVQHYEFVDKAPFSGINYYRLWQVDFDGTIDYSPIVSVRFTTKAANLTLYPNPTAETLTLELGTDWESTTEITIFDLAGKQVQALTVDAGQTTLNVADLSFGYYQLVAKNGSNIQTQTFVKQ